MPGRDGAASLTRSGVAAATTVPPLYLGLTRSEINNGNSRIASRVPEESCDSSRAYGRGAGAVGRGRGVGVGRVSLGVPVGVADTVAVAVAVAVAVGVAVAVAVGEGVGVPHGLTGQLKISVVAMMVTPSLA